MSRSIFRYSLPLHSSGKRPQSGPSAFDQLASAHPIRNPYRGPQTSVPVQTLPRSLSLAKHVREKLEKKDARMQAVRFMSGAWTSHVRKKSFNVKAFQDLQYVFTHDPVIDRHCIHVEFRKRRGLQQQLPTWQTYGFYKEDKKKARAK
eukprot:TRINITY_DN45741_c0_g1_i1.p1 TRINITY_DN45741_c0_g1~~TRINITY_DN45741_c0_g1_i1.p1  ORF type:complete len:148 (+),score=11.92 TRINITY_DN45741_c0_g1_i1:177-620(+)